MNLTSTLLTVELGALATILGIVFLIFNYVKDMNLQAIEEVKRNVKLESTVKFQGERIDRIENTIAGNSGFRVQ